MARAVVRSHAPRKTARRGSWCQPCNARGGPDHLTSETHRHRMASRDAVGPIGSAASEYAARVRRSMREPRATIYQEAQSAAWLAGGEYAQWLAGLDDGSAYDPIRPDDPDAADCELCDECQDADMRSLAPRKNGRTAANPRVKAPTIPACPRCGRSDWSTPAGREWHVLRNPDCLRFRQPARHEYVTIGG